MPDVREFDGYFFDLDGTIFLGDRLLPGVKEALAYLRERGKKIYFLSNTTVRTRKECRLRLQELGLEAHEEEVVTAAYAAAVYLRESGLPRVFVVGDPALFAELDEQGVAHTPDPLSATHVLVGMDRGFNYDKLHQAMKAVASGAVLIAANPDPFCPAPDDRLPDTWSMVKAIETAGCSEAPTVIGKPSAYYAAKVLEWSKLSYDRCLMVGDRLETDILFGLQNGMRTALVLTGVTSRSDMECSPIRPDYVWSTMEELLQP
ncbi:HAD-IIA family hydrolase [Paenibacillus sp. PDC88]|uniref:HAD-IIA family hydrolase n=1 Tax=Paenibacillus TaxID=44249 RepID=UPI00089B899C|nr:HAD-IIA family hydrolase [Paenibacillus sp. PDC88]SDX83121.1 phosphoglycolate/pyridoxal phosphate phosphatase family/Haloacid Dehalogenase Superfamily Class (subfamily) IIA [Paenibacillus sp. PDC88]